MKEENADAVVDKRSGASASASVTKKPAARSVARDPIVIGGRSIQAGQRCYIDLPLPPLYTHTSVAMPVHVIHGRQPGPVLFVTAAIHGDEINGIEIIRRLLATKSLSRLAGTLIAVPVVNVYGFVSQSRYLPDRRDLNRSFPGSETGSMAARLADTLMSEIVAKCTHGIDLHTAAEGRSKPWLANHSVWMRAPQSGILRSRIPLGGIVDEGVVLGFISDPFGESEQAVVSDVSGVLIGITKLPLVHEGEALYHVATTGSTRSAARALDDFHLEYEQPVIKRLK